MTLPTIKSFVEPIPVIGVAIGLKVFSHWEIVEPPNQLR